jgi:hypothetical protein
MTIYDDTFLFTITLLFLCGSGVNHSDGGPKRPVNLSCCATSSHPFIPSLSILLRRTHIRRAVPYRSTALNFKSMER